MDDSESVATTPGSRDSGTAPVAMRGRDPWRKVKADRRRSQSVGASPATRAFGVALKHVAKPKGQLVKV